MEIKRTIKYDADRVKGFGREIMSVSGCDQLPSCIQCGTCSGACPLSIYMDFSPRQVMALVRADFKNEVLRSNTHLALRLLLRLHGGMSAPDSDHGHHVCPQAAGHQGACLSAHFPIPILAKEFAKMVRRKGRITETLLVMQLFLRANWRAVLSSWRLGLGLITTGRFVHQPEHIERQAELEAMLATVRQRATERRTA